MTKGPLVILISGGLLVGKSTIAKLLYDHIKENVNIISTNDVLDVLRDHVRKKEEPILHSKVYKCGKFIKDEDEC